MDYKTIAIVGANGTIGARVAGMLAAHGNARVFMICRSMEAAKQGIQKAQQSVRSTTIESRLIPFTLDHCENALNDADWIFESVTEDFEVKRRMNDFINKHASDDCLISSGTSGISLTELSRSFSKSKQAHYMGTHFFNPPSKMTACELVATEFTDQQYYRDVTSWLEKTLFREVIPVSDQAAFAGNRVGFQLLDEAVRLAERESENGGVDYVDYLFSNGTGRTMAPLRTLDFVGLDVYRAIMNNIHDKLFSNQHKRLCGYVQRLVSEGRLGVKSRRGFYRYEKGEEEEVYDVREGTYRPSQQYHIDTVETLRQLVRTGRYNQLIPYLLQADDPSARLIVEHVLHYIRFSYELIPTVVSEIRAVDHVMMSGFAWVAPSTWVSLIASIDTLNKLFERYSIPITNDLLDRIQHQTPGLDIHRKGRRYFCCH